MSKVHSMGSDTPKKKWCKENTRKLAAAVKPHEALFDITSCAIGVTRALQCLNSSQIDWNHPYAVVYSTTDRCYWLLLDSEHSSCTIEDFRTYASDYALYTRGLTSSSRKSGGKSSTQSVISNTSNSTAGSGTHNISSISSTGSTPSGSTSTTPTLPTSGSTPHRSTPVSHSTHRSPHKMSPYRGPARGASPYGAHLQTSLKNRRNSSIGRRKTTGSTTPTHTTVSRTHSPHATTTIRKSAHTPTQSHTHTPTRSSSSTPVASPSHHRVATFAPIAPSDRRTHLTPSGKERGTPRTHSSVSVTTTSSGTPVSETHAKTTSADVYITPRRQTASPLREERGRRTPVRISTSPMPQTRRSTSNKRSSSSKLQWQGFTYTCLGRKLDPYSPEFDISHAVTGIHKAVEMLNSGEIEWDKPYAIVQNKRDGNYYLIARPHHSCTPCYVLTWKTVDIQPGYCYDSDLLNWTAASTAGCKEETQAVSGLSGIYCITYNIGSNCKNSGPNELTTRMEYIIQLLQFHRPHIVALQEMTTLALQLLLKSDWVQESYSLSHVSVEEESGGDTERTDTATGSGNVVLLFHSQTMKCLNITQYHLPSFKSKKALIATFEIEVKPVLQGRSPGKNLPNQKTVLTVSTLQLENGHDSISTRAHQCSLLYEALLDKENVLLLGDFNTPYIQEIQEMQTLFCDFQNCWETLTKTSPPATHMDGHHYHHMLLKSKRWKPIATKLLGTTPFFSAQGAAVAPSLHLSMAMRFAWECTGEAF
eukprot:TRINITY_DN67542_c6_g1_i1.p1 TRINITY_DN67542_c6_g1~~TRINITY_DN67542_c6_g1_i1.p1  ORF type:complete len:761 (-),score=15.94 TRINITY_DN67542_c6_g1_i1:100-2382(-)